MLRKAKTCLLITILIVLALLPFACNVDKNSNMNAGKIKVFVSILPQKHFVEKIGGNLVEVSVMTRPGQNPHTYEPTPKQMTALTRTDIFFSIGISYEDVWLSKINDANPSLKIIPTQKGIQRKTIEDNHYEKSESQKSGKQGVILDPHIWLSPRLVQIQADTTAAALIKEMPARKTEIETNLSSFKKELVELDKTINLKFKGIKNRAFLVFHPSWGYFADDYGLEQIAIEKEGKEPSAKTLNSLIILAKKKNIKVVFVQEQFTRTYAEAVANAIHGKVISIDSLEENYSANLLKVTELLAAAMK